MSDVEQFFILLNALLGCATYELSNCTPHRWENFGEMKQHLLFVAGPFCLFDRRVKPLIPSSLALFGTLTNKERRDSTPLIESVLHDGGLENLIF